MPPAPVGPALSSACLLQLSTHPPSLRPCAPPSWWPGGQPPSTARRSQTHTKEALHLGLALPSRCQASPHPSSQHQIEADQLLASSQRTTGLPVLGAAMHMPVCSCFDLPELFKPESGLSQESVGRKRKLPLNSQAAGPGRPCWLAESNLHLSRRMLSGLCSLEGLGALPVQ